MRDVPVTAAGSIGPELLARLRAQLRQRPTLGDVLVWAQTQRPPAGVAEIVTQDEYTHDVIVRTQPPAFVVFDTT